MTYTYITQFHSLKTYFIFLLQTLPALFCIYYPLKKRFPFIFSTKQTLFLALFNLLFNYVCSYYLFMYQIPGCITTSYNVVISFSFFQLIFYLIWRKINIPKLNLFVFSNLLISLILLSMMSYIRLAVYSYFLSYTALHYLIELLPVLFIFVTFFIFNLLDRVIQSTVTSKRLTTLTLLLLVYNMLFNIYPQFINVFCFSPEPRMTIFEGFLFTNTLARLFPNVVLVVYSEPSLLYQCSIVFFILGCCLLCAYFAILFIARKKEEELTRIRHEKELREHIAVIENIVKEVQIYQHDYKNILLSLKHHVETSPGISEEFQTYFQHVLDDFHLNTHAISIPSLENIQIKEIYSLILGKYQYAKLKNIAIHIEIPFNVSFDYFDTFYYCKILGILIDNAFNAALLCETPQVEIALISEKDKTVFIVQNNTVSSNVRQDIQLSSGSITKGGHGYGMSIVQTIIHDHDNITLDSTQTGFIFKHVLTINKTTHSN